MTSFHVEDREGRRLTAARSGMDIVFVFGYQCRHDEIPQAVDVGFSISSAHDQMLFVLYSSFTGKTFMPMSSSGTFRCYVAKLPLSAGRYRVGGRVTVGGEEADWPSIGIGYLDVVSGDFYGTGSKGFDRSTPFLVAGKWEARDA